MSEYIDREKVVSILNGWSGGYSYIETPVEAAIEEIRAIPAADAIEKLQKAVMRLEEENGILDELPMVDQSTPCETCVHKGNVDFDYCHICNNEADMYKPEPPKEET